jgi:hypothetical protein
MWHLGAILETLVHDDWVFEGLSMACGSVVGHVARSCIVCCYEMGGYFIMGIWYYAGDAGQRQQGDGRTFLASQSMRHDSRFVFIDLFASIAIICLNLVMKYMTSE